MAFSLAPVSAPAPVSGWLARNWETPGPWRPYTARTASWRRAVRDDPARGVPGWECGDRGQTASGGDSEGVSVYFFFGSRALGSPRGAVWARTSVVAGWDPSALDWASWRGHLHRANPSNPPAGLFVWEAASPLSLQGSALACFSFYFFWFVASHVLGTPLSRLARWDTVLAPPSIHLRARTERMCALRLIETPGKIVTKQERKL